LGGKEKFWFFFKISPFVVPHEGVFSDNRGTFPYIFEILEKIREILEKIREILVKIREILVKIREILRKIYGVFKAIFGILCKIERVLKEMRGVFLPISRVARKTREIRTMIWVNRHGAIRSNAGLKPSQTAPGVSHAMENLSGGFFGQIKSRRAGLRGRRARGSRCGWEMWLTANAGRTSW
jgi:hypothetical protein